MSEMGGRWSVAGPHWRRAALALAPAAAVASLLCVAGAAVAPAPVNVLLVTIDTLRVDRVGAYGSRAGLTPAMDALAKGGVVFEQATVPVPLTRPSHVSLLTGKLPFQHGIRDNFSFSLGAGHRTLAEVLKTRGYATGGFVGRVHAERPVRSEPGVRRVRRLVRGARRAVGVPRGASAPCRRDRAESRRVDRARGAAAGRRSSPGFTSTIRTRLTTRPPPYAARYAAESVRRGGGVHGQRPRPAPRPP